MQQVFPAGTVQRVLITDVHGNLSIAGWEQQTMQVVSSGNSAVMQPEGDVLLINDCEDSLELQVPFETIIIASKIDGDVHIEQVRQIELRTVNGDIDVRDINGTLLLTKVKGDVTLNEIGAEVTLADLYGELAVRSAPVVRIRGDMKGDVTLFTIGRIEVEHISSDMMLTEVTEVVVGNVASDLQVVGGTNVQVGNVGSDCELRNVQGDIRLGNVGSDIKLTGVGGTLHLGNIGSDATIKGFHGSIQGGMIGADLYLQADFPAGTTTRLQVGKDAHVLLPDHPNVTIQASAGGSVRGDSVAASSPYGSTVNLIYGDGSAKLELQVGCNLTLRCKESPRSSSSSSGGKWETVDWTDFGKEMSQWGRDFGQEMAQWGNELGRDINTAVHDAITTFGKDFTRHTKDHVSHAQRFAEAQTRRAERLAKAQTRRAERLAEMQRRRAEEQARRTGQRATRANTRQNNFEQEREAVLRMIAEGRITPEEGDLLLDALGG